MITLRRSSIVMLALLLMTTLVSAQDDGEATAEPTPEATAEVTVDAPDPTDDSSEDADSVTVAGSGIVNPLLEELAAASEADTTLDITTTGTAPGLEQFCTNEATLATATRSLSVQEETRCIDNGVEFAELLLGHNILTFIGNPQDDFLRCLTSDNINTLFAPSGVTVTNWSQLTPEQLAQTSEGQESPYPDLAISVQVPPTDTLTYATLDDIVEGIGLRPDAQSVATSDIIDTVSSTSGAIGVVPLQAVDAADADVNVLNINFADVESGCEAPSANNVEDRLYTAATPLLVYVNRAALDGLSDLLTFISDSDNAQVIADAGYTLASQEAFETNRAIIAGEEDERAFSLSEPAFEVPSNLTGTLNVGGTTYPYRVVDTIASRLSGGGQPQPQQLQQLPQGAAPQGLTINVTPEGETNDVADFCAGELDAVMVRGDGLDEEQQAACDENNVTPVAFPLGVQAAVLVGHEGDDYSVCLTVDQVATIWRADSTEEITNWNQVGESLPDQAMTLFGIDAGNVLSDILLNAVREGAPLPVRIDTELDSDPLYRAAAVANVEGALAYMSWLDYQQVVEREQAGIQLVAIDNGNGCIVPNDDSLDDGTYALSVDTSLVVSQESLANIALQSYLWTLYSDENFAQFENNDISGIAFGDLADIRDDLLIAFQQAAEAEQTRLQAEVTPEATAEATAETP